MSADLLLPDACELYALAGNVESPVYEVFALLFGLCVGSFANVCIWRIPNALAQHEHATPLTAAWKAASSVASPRSMCPGCRQPIAAWDNLPLVSWLLLRARCRTCGSPISVR